MREAVLYEEILTRKRAVSCYGLPQAIVQTSLDLTVATNARFAPDLEGRFDLVWMFDQPVNFWYQWQHIVISGLRLLSDAGGIIVIKACDTYIAPAATVFSFLESNLAKATVLDSYAEPSTGYLVKVFKVAEKSGDLRVPPPARNKKCSPTYIAYRKCFWRIRRSRTG